MTGCGGDAGDRVLRLAGHLAGEGGEQCHSGAERGQGRAVTGEGSSASSNFLPDLVRPLEPARNLANGHFPSTLNRLQSQVAAALGSHRPFALETLSLGLQDRQSV